MPASGPRSRGARAHPPPHQGLQTLARRSATSRLVLTTQKLGGITGRGTSLRVLYFGTYERDYPRNAQVISALRAAGVEVVERHARVWEGGRDNWRPRLSSGLRLMLAEARLWWPPRG